MSLELITAISLVGDYAATVAPLGIPDSPPIQPPGTEGVTTIRRSDCVDISYPGFFRDLEKLQR